MKKATEGTKRVFICLDFPDEVIKEIARVQGLLAKNKFIGKLTELENLHLTLKFLGEISHETLEDVKSKLEKIKVPCLDLRLSEVGTFRYKGSPRIAWIKVSGAFEIQSKIDSALEELFPKEKRFMSHLTIARIKYVKNKQAFCDSVANLSVKKIRFSSGKFKLISSELATHGPIYEVLEEYQLS